MDPFPPIEAQRTGLLARGQGQVIHWEASGEARGLPLLFLHGGPGGGLKTGHRRLADPKRFWTVAFDQRGCGRSHPWATEAPEALATQGMADHIADVEALRRHLGVEAWLLCGGSWGTALALAYAQAHPQRVLGLALASIHLPTPEVVAWMTEGLQLLFPREWAAFASAVPWRSGQRLVEAYLEALTGPDPGLRRVAAEAWCAWEDAHVSLAPQALPNPDFQDPAYALNFATLVTQTWSQGAGLRPGQLQVDLPRMAHLPGAIIHGRLDVSSPMQVAWQLHQAWPNSRYLELAGEGHGGPAMGAALRHEIARLGAAVG